LGSTFINPEYRSGNLANVSLTATIRPTARRYSNPQYRFHISNTATSVVKYRSALMGCGCELS
jgi:hypothetical protein